MSSEWVRGLSTDETADVFSLCVMLCELIDGRHPLGRVPAHEPRYGPDIDTLMRIRDLDYALPAQDTPLVRVIRANLVRDPRTRMSVDQCRRALLDAARDAGLEVGPDAIAALRSAIEHARR